MRLRLRDDRLERAARIVLAFQLLQSALADETRVVAERPTVDREACQRPGGREQRLHAQRLRRKMFEKEHASIRLADSSHFTEYRERVVELACDQRHDDGVEVSLVERDTRNVADLRVEASTAAYGLRLCFLECVGGDVDTDDIAALRIVMEVLACAHANFQNAPQGVLRDEHFCGSI